MSALKSKIKFVFFIIVCISLQTSFAQSLAFKPPSNKEVFFSPRKTTALDTAKEFDPFGADTLQVMEKPELLPDKISFMENTLWGENGLVRKFGLSGDLTPETRKNELNVRRTMLTIHQLSGFTTLGLMLASAYVGQKVIDGRRDLGDTHKGLVAASIATYSLTGLLAILSPPPSIRRDDFSSITLHKTLAWVHIAGMIITPILGSFIEEHHTFNIDKAHIHQISGYITTAVFATSMLIITF